MCSGSGTSNKAKVCKLGSARPKHRGKISVMTCSPFRVLENIVVTDAMGKDVIFPIGINITEGGMNACRDLQEVHRDSIYGMEDGENGDRTIK